MKSLIIMITWIAACFGFGYYVIGPLIFGK